jgi:hypothetical protein
MRRYPARLLLTLSWFLPVVGASAAHAQVGLAVRASTLGIGGELSFRAARNLGIRLGGNYLQFSRDATVENIDYRLTPHLENGTAILDFHPFGGSFHLSGGLLLNYNEGRMVATLNSNIEIGDSTYTPQQVGSLNGSVSFKKTAPYLGLGFAGRSRIAVLFDLGVGFTGRPAVELIGQTNLTGNAKSAFDSNVAKEQQEAQDEIDSHKILRYHPVVSFGIKVSF